MKIFCLPQVNTLFCLHIFVTIICSRYNRGVFITVGFCTFFQLETIYDAMLSRHVILWTHQCLYEIILFFTGKALLFPLIKACIELTRLFLNRNFKMCFSTLKKDGIEYVRCKRSQSCLLLEVLGGSVLISINWKDDRVQSFYTMIRPAVAILIAFSKTTFCLRICWSCALLCFSFKSDYRMLRSWMVFLILFYLNCNEIAK